jgi:hypothetical protein
VSDRDSKFTSNFWKGIFKGFGTNMNFSTTYHPETDGQTERVNQVIEDMLRMYVMDKPSKWEDYLHLVEFSYNNGYQASLKMSPFEALYGRKCNTPVSWDNPTDHTVVGPDLLRGNGREDGKDKEKFKGFPRQEENCTDKGRTHREFKVGDHVFFESEIQTQFPEVGEVF